MSTVRVDSRGVELPLESCSALRGFEHLLHRSVLALSRAGICDRCPAEGVPCTSVAHQAEEDLLVDDQVQVEQARLEVLAEPVEVGPLGDRPDGPE